MVMITKQLLKPEKLILSGSHGMKFLNPISETENRVFYAGPVLKSQEHNDHHMHNRIHFIVISHV